MLFRTLLLSPFIIALSAFSNESVLFDLDFVKGPSSVQSEAIKVIGGQRTVLVMGENSVKTSPYRETSIALWTTNEWTIHYPEYGGNPFDLPAYVMFEHENTGETIRTDMFYSGSNQWKFRFTGTKTGKWRFQTGSTISDLSDIEGRVVVTPNPDINAHGFMTNYGSKWGWQSNGEFFIPQYVMGKDVNYYFDFEKNEVDITKIDEDIQVFVEEHGFTGFHMRLNKYWFDINGELTQDHNPDIRSYRVLETIIQRVHQKGGACHIWVWGADKKSGKGGDGPRGVVAGPMSDGDKRNLRYLAARLGPLPGWSLGYGFDTENLWASPDELSTWKKFLEDRMGWGHFIGSRVGFDEKGTWGQYGQHIPKAPLNEKHNAPIGDNYLSWPGGDYIGYTSYRPYYDRYVEVIDHQPARPSFDEDRFRIRSDAKWTHKDYDGEMTMRGLWHSALAGGVANIWGNLIPNDDHGGSLAYDQGGTNIKHLIKTYATFFRDKKRFLKDYIRDNSLTDSYSGTTEQPEPDDISACLRTPDYSHFVFYKENTDSVRMDLSNTKSKQPAVAVDTQKAYEEIDLGNLDPKQQTWKAPYKSTWAIAVGRFGSNPNLGKNSSAFQQSNFKLETLWSKQLDPRWRPGGNVGNLDDGITCEFVEFSSDGTMLVTANGIGDAFVLDSSDGTILQTFKYITEQDISHVKSFDISGGKMKGLEVECGAFTPDNRYLILGGNLNGIKIYDLKDGSLAKHIKVNEEVDGLGVSPDGRFLAHAAPMSAQVISLKDYSPIVRIMHGNQEGVINSADFTNDSKLMASAGNYGHVLINRTSDFTLIGDGHIAKPASIKSVRFSPDGAYVAAGYKSNCAAVFETKTMKLLQQFPLFYVEAVEWTLDGNYLMVGGRDNQGRLRVFRVSDWALVADPLVQEDNSNIEYIDVFEDKIAIVGEDAHIRLFQLTN